MTPEEIAQLQEIYDEAIRRLDALNAKKLEIIKGYIKELEEQKIKALRESLGLQANQE